MRRGREKEMNVIGHDLKSQDITLQFRGSLPDDLHEPVADWANQDLPSSLRTEDDVIVHQEDAGFLVAILLTHARILVPIVSFANSQQHN